MKKWKVEDILDHYDEIFSQPKKEQFAEDRRLDIQVLNDLFMELNRFALNTHTIGNYMPCPDGDYNAIKGFFGFKYFQDRLDLLYDELVNYKHEDIKKLSQEKRQSYIKWLDSYKEKLYIENMMEKDKLDYFCAVRGNNRCIINDKKELNNFLNYLKIINPLIEKRGLIIESELKKNL